jgi:NRPS condensation-like uncharacterized protein
LKGFTLRDRLRALSTAFGPSAEEIREFRQKAGLAFEIGSFNLLTRSLPAEDFKSMRAAVKALGFTVNDLFMASLVLAYHRVREVDKILLPCTIDLRRFVRHRYAGITNLAGRCPCVIQLSSDDAIEEVMAKVVEQMKLYKQGLYAVSCIVSWQARLKTASPQQIRQMFQNNDLTFPLSSSNLGILNEDCVRFGDVSVRSAYLAAPAAPPTALLIGLSTFRDELTVLTCIESDDAAKDFVDAVLTAMIEELLAFASRCH